MPFTRNVFSFFIIDLCVRTVLATKYKIIRYDKNQAPAILKFVVTGIGITKRLEAPTLT